MPEPPYGPGDRVRCLVSTAAERGGVELRGLVGTVTRCAEFGPSWSRGWVVRVVWDGLLPPRPAHHAPAELEMVSVG
jgi:hypothetical protein